MQSLQVQDINDNKPEFRGKLSEIQIEANDTFGQLVYNASAADLDIYGTK